MLDFDPESAPFWNRSLGAPVKWLTVALATGLIVYLALWPSLAGPPRGYHWWMEVLCYEYRGKYGQWPSSFEDILSRATPEFRHRLSEMTKYEDVEWRLQGSPSAVEAKARLEWSTLIFRRGQEYDLRLSDHAAASWARKDRFFPPVE